MAEEDLVARLRATGQTAFSRSLRTAASDVRSVGQASGATEKAGRSLAAGFGIMGTAARGAAVVAGGGLAVALGTGARAGWGYNKMIDAQRVGFTTLLGSQSKALDFMGQIQALALKSPVLDPESTGDSARLLMAYGVNAKKVLPMVEALGDMSAATGKSIAETMPRGAMALGQIASKGKLQSEELNQLAESVGLSRDRIRKALNMSRDDFAAAFTPGNNISASKALPAILEAMRTQSEGAAERLSKTTAGRVDRLREVFRKKMGEFTRGAYDQVGNFAGGLADRLQAIDPAKIIARAKGIADTGKSLAIAFSKGIGGGGQAGGGIFGMARTVGDRLRGIGQGAAGVGRQIVSAFAPAMPFLSNVLLPLLQGVAQGVIGGVVVAFKVAVPIIRLLSTALGWIGTKAAPLRPLIVGIGTVIGFVFGGPILSAIGTLGRLGSIFRIVAPLARLLALPIRLVGVAFGGVLKFAGGIVRFLGGALPGATAKVVVAIANMLGHVAALPGRLFGFAKSAASRFASGLGGLGGRLVSIGKGFVTSIVNGIKSMPGTLMDAFRGILGDAVNALPGPLKSAAGSLLGLVTGGSAAGGTITRSGPRLVGERGPEVIDAKRGDYVTPNARLGAPAGLPRGRAALFHGEFPLMLHGRELGRGVARIAADDLAGP